MAAARRSPRDERRRRLGQNFLRPERAEQLVHEAGIRGGDLVVDIGAGPGAVSLALARAGAEVVAVEVDPIWAERLRTLSSKVVAGRIRVVEADFLSFRLPARPFRVVSCIPFGVTTSILHRLLDDPCTEMRSANLIVQFEVAQKRAANPPATLLSASWAPWWEMRLGRRVPAGEFRPVPRVDAAVLAVTRRDPPLLPPHMAGAYAGFLRAHWPF